MKRQTMMRRSLSGVLAAGCLSLAMSTSATAFADQRVISGNDDSIAAESVDSSRAVSLKVRKVAPNPYDEVPEGDRPFGGVAGLTFTLSKVDGVDVTTSAGRAAAKDMTVDKARENGLIKIGSQQTDANGEALFTDLHPGLYLIEEQEPADDGFDYRTSSPRLVILPLGDVTGEGFTYDNVVVTKPKPNEPGVPPTPPTIPGIPGIPTTPDKPDKPGEPNTPGGHESTPPRPGDGSTPTPTPGDTPENPNHPGGSNGGDSENGSESHNPGRGFLAETGANVLWIVGGGVLLILAGILLSRRGKSDERGEA